MTRHGIGSALGPAAHKLRVGGKVYGEVDPTAALYQTTAHWFTPGRGERPVLVLGEEEWAAVVRLVRTVEYISPTTNRYWSASIDAHHTIRTPNGQRWAVGPDKYVETIVPR